jgi:hypothetical protein
MPQRRYDGHDIGNRQYIEPVEKSSKAKRDARANEKLRDRHVSC